MYYFDGPGQDTVTENQSGKWIAMIGSVVINDTSHHIVGSYNIKGTSGSSLGVMLFCSTGSVDKKFTDFNSVKFYIAADATYTTLEIAITGGGNSLAYVLDSIPGTMTAFDILLPTDVDNLNGWSLSGSWFDTYDTFAVAGLNATNGKDLWLDGLTWSSGTKITGEIDAILVPAIAGTIDAVLKKSLTKTSLVDSIVVRIKTKTATIDAVSPTIEEIDGTIDAFLLPNFGGTIDGYAVRSR